MARKSIKLALSSLVLASALTYSAPKAMAREDPVCNEGTADLCASTCGEDFPGVQITQVCATYNGQTSCECCCYYEEIN
jgi:hypothetical protein